MWRRLAALAYESVLLFAVLFVGAYLFVAIAGRSPDGVLRWIFFSYLACLAGAYFVFCWMRSGQTLAQKAWGMKVVGNDGALLSMRAATLRYLLALAGVTTGVSLLWAAFDPQRQFLHDRLLGSRIVLTAARPGEGGQS